MLNPSIAGKRFDEIEAWEKEIDEYRNISGTSEPSDAVMYATVMSKLATGALRTHLRTNSNRFNTYAKIREEMKSYFISGRRFDAGVAMDLDSLAPGKGGGGGGGGG